MSNLELAKLRHELRGCLNAISLSVEALKLMVMPNEPAGEFLVGIANEVAKADRLLQLALSIIRQIAEKNFLEGRNESDERYISRGKHFHFRDL